MRGAIIIEGHVQGLSNVRALGEKGIPVYVMDVCHCLAQHSKYCRKFFKCPPFNSSAFIDFLLEIGVKEELEGWVLIPSNDHIVENLSLNTEKLYPFFKTIAPKPEILNNIVNKKNLLRVAESSGVPFPKTCYPETYEDITSMRFPLLIKGNKGLSFYKTTHVKAIQVNNRKEADEVMGYLKHSISDDEIMIQELIPFDVNYKVVSFTCFATEGDIKTFWMGDKLREHPIKYGTATYSRSVYIPEILEIAKPLMLQLGYTGVCEIEFLWDNRDKAYKLIEINPRTWLWVGLAKACGIDYAYMVYAYLNNQPIEYPSSYKVGLKWINWVTDSVYSMVAICKRQLSFKEYLSSLRGEKVRAIWSARDIMPGLVFPFLLLYIARKRG